MPGIEISRIRNMRKGMTVGELKRLLAPLDDGLELVGQVIGMERSGIMPIGIHPRVERMRIEKRRTHDEFDWTEYSYEVYVPAKDGDKEVVRLYQSEDT